MQAGQTHSSQYFSPILGVKQQITGLCRPTAVAEPQS